MAWTTPRSWSTGETVTSTILNTHVRDNLNAIVSPPYAYLRAPIGTDVGGSSSTHFAINFGTEVADTNGMFVSGSRLTIATAGVYMLSGGYSITLTAGDKAAARFSVNSLLIPHSGNTVVCGATSRDVGLSIQCFYQLAVGDYVELRANTTRTTITTLASTGDQAYLQARWMGPAL